MLTYDMPKTPKQTQMPLYYKTIKHQIAEDTTQNNTIKENTDNFQEVSIKLYSI